LQAAALAQNGKGPGSTELKNGSKGPPPREKKRHESEDPPLQLVKIASLRPD